MSASDNIQARLAVMEFVSFALDHLSLDAGCELTTAWAKYQLKDSRPVPTNPQTHADLGTPL